MSVVVKGPDALKSQLYPAATAFVQSLDIARERFQSVQSVSEQSLTEESSQAVAIEQVLQTVGLAKHPLSDKPGESLLDRYNRIHETQQELKPVDQDKSPLKQRPGGESPVVSAEAMDNKKRLLLEAEQSKLLPAVEEELLANVDASDMSAREYAMKYAMPALHRGLCMVGRVRPDDPVDFMGQFMLDYDPSSTEVLEPGNLILPTFGKKKP